MPALTFKERDDQMAELRKQSQGGNAPTFDMPSAMRMGYTSSAPSPSSMPLAPTQSMPTGPRFDQAQTDRMWRTFNNPNAFGRDRRIAGDMIKSMYSLQNQQALEGMRGTNQLANTGLGGQYQLANTGLQGQNQLNYGDLMGRYRLGETDLAGRYQLENTGLAGQNQYAVEGLRGQNTIDLRRTPPDEWTQRIQNMTAETNQQNANTNALQANFQAARDQGALFGQDPMMPEAQREMIRRSMGNTYGWQNPQVAPTEAIPTGAVGPQGTRPMSAGGSGRGAPQRAPADRWMGGDTEPVAMPAPASAALPTAATQLPQSSAQRGMGNIVDQLNKQGYNPADITPERLAAWKQQGWDTSGVLDWAQQTGGLSAQQLARLRGGYAEGGMVGQALWQDPTQGFGQPPSIQSLDPMVREYAQYVSTATQNNLQPLGFGKFMDLLASTRKRMQQLPTTGYQYGFADGGQVEQPWYSFLLPSYSNPYVNGPAPAAPPVSPPSRDQAVQMLGSGLAGQAANAIRGRQDQLNSVMRDIKGYAGGGAIPVAGKQVLGPGTGTSDSIPAVIDGTQPAAISSGEFIFPTDVTNYWGTAKLQSMIDKARQNG